MATNAKRKPTAAKRPPAGAPSPGGPSAASPSGPPAAEPVGRALASTAKLVSRAFERELAEAGGSQPVWLILLALKQQSWRTQQQIAAAVGIEGPTLTHHLDGLDKAGLIKRERDPNDRRAVGVELTAAGDKLFLKLAQAAVGFDQRLSAGLSDKQLDAFRSVLGRLRDNVAPD
jgi:MarR family transcriptional regulator, transcriptional regulator for hemolysin